jgi:hypothetical protein
VTVIVIGATKTISKSTRKFLSSITGKHEIKNYRKQPAIFGTAHL